MVVGSFREIENESQVQKVILVWVGVQSLIGPDPIRSHSIPFDPLPAHLLRSKLAPLTGSLCALMRINLNSSINVMGTQIRRMRALTGPGGAMSA